MRTVKLFCLCVCYISLFVSTSNAVPGVWCKHDSSEVSWNPAPCTAINPESLSQNANNELVITYRGTIESASVESAFAAGQFLVAVPKKSYESALTIPQIYAQLDQAANLGFPNIIVSLIFLTIARAYLVYNEDSLTTKLHLQIENVLPDFTEVFAHVDGLKDNTSGNPIPKSNNYFTTDKWFRTNYQNFESIPAQTFQVYMFQEIPGAIVESVTAIQTDNVTGESTALPVAVVATAPNANYATATIYNPNANAIIAINIQIIDANNIPQNQTFILATAVGSESNLPYLIFSTDSLRTPQYYTGNLGGITGADAKCESAKRQIRDLNPNLTTHLNHHFKALLLSSGRIGYSYSESLRRTPCQLSASTNNSMCDVSERTNWTLESNTQYINSRNEYLGTSNIVAIIPSLMAPISRHPASYHHSQWTGARWNYLFHTDPAGRWLSLAQVNPIFTPYLDCNSWTSSSSGVFATRGLSNLTSPSYMHIIIPGEMIGRNNCNNHAAIYCVESSS